MDLQTRKLQFIKEILSIGNEKVIEKLEALLKKEQQKEGDQRISIEQYNKEIDEAEAEMDKGEIISHEDLKRQMKKW